jgi:hypothetical protein
MIGEAEDRSSGDVPRGTQEEPSTDAALTSAGQGICAELGVLPQGTLITEKGLAALLGKAVKSIKRAVKRGELPPSVRILGERRWTVGVVLRHIEERLDRAAREAERERRRFEGNTP